MRNVQSLAVGGLFMVALGCGGGAGQTQVPGTTLAPGATAPGAPTPDVTGSPVAPTIAPQATPGSVPVGDACASVPPIDPLASGEPEMTADPELEALFPAEIDGQPVENVNSLRWLEYLCRYDPEAVGIAAGAAAAAGIPLLTLTYASAQATVDDQSVSIDAFRTPGLDANVMIAQFQQVVLMLGGTIEEQGGTLSQATVGGKNAYIWTQPDDDTTYLYVRADVMFGMNGVDDAQAATIFAALP